MGEVKHLQDKEAIKKMQEIASDTNTCMFCTDIEQAPFPTTPMATQKVDDEETSGF